MSNKPEYQNLLHTEAETQLDQEPSTGAATRSVDEFLHELQVHQIELEMQNEELRRAQVVMEEMRDRYLDLYELAPVGYITLTREGMIAEANLTGAAMLGVDRKNLLGRRFAAFVSPEDSDKWNRHFLTVLKRDGRQHCELVLRRSDGLCIEARLTSLKAGDSLSAHEPDDSSQPGDKPNKSPLLRIVITDISEIKAAEKMLWEKNQLLDSIIDNIPNMIFLKRASDLCFELFNKAGENLLGYSRTDLLGKGNDDFWPREQADWFTATDRKVLASAAVTEIPEEAIRTASGETRYLHTWKVPLHDKGGEPTHLLGISVDITERKKMEMEIQERRNEMEELQKMHVAAQTAAAIAHEINQPLLAICTYSEAAQMLLKAENPNLDKVHKAMAGCEQQALRAGKAIRELLEFLSAKEFPTEDFDLNQEILGVIGAAKSEHEMLFQPILRLEEGLALVRANRTHVQKALLNLLRNSVDSMQEAGVSLPAITVLVRTLTDKCVAQVTIQDNGPGVKQEDFQKLFEPFFTTKSKGIGMGLAISRALIEENGGQLWIDPQEGPGAIFHLTLPFAT